MSISNLLKPNSFHIQAENLKFSNGKVANQKPLDVFANYTYRFAAGDPDPEGAGNNDIRIVGLAAGIYVADDDIVVKLIRIGNVVTCELILKNGNKAGAGADIDILLKNAAFADFVPTVTEGVPAPIINNNAQAVGIISVQRVVNPGPANGYVIFKLRKEDGTNFTDAAVAGLGGYVTAKGRAVFTYFI